MDDRSIISYLETKLNFSKDSIKKIKIYLNELLKVNKSYNLIGKSTETAYLASTCVRFCSSC